MTHDDSTKAEVVEQAIRAVIALDIAGARKFLADDLVLELPFRGGGHARTLVGADAHAFMAVLPKLLERMQLTDLVVHGETPSGVVAAEYASDGTTRTGRTYANHYAALFEVTDGRITRWREYFNPDVVSAAFE